MSICEIMEDIRQNVDGFFKVRQVYRLISAKEIDDDYKFEFQSEEEED